MTTTNETQVNPRAEELMKTGMRMLLSDEEKDFMVDYFKDKFWEGNYHVGEPEVSQISANDYFWVYFDIELAKKTRFLTEIFTLGYKCGKNSYIKYK